MKTLHLLTSRDRGLCMGADAPASAPAGRLARVLQLCLAVVAALLLVAVAAPLASAAPLGVLGVSGSNGTGDGQFQGTGGVAVNESTGDVYVIDIGGQRVERFGAAGAFEDSFGSAGTGDGQFAFETVRGLTPQLAVDQSDGSIYVTDTGNDRVQKFSSTGAYQSQFGATGTGDGQLSKPVGVAVDPTDQTVYVSDNDNDRIQKFSSAGVYILQFGSQGTGGSEAEDQDAAGQFSLAAGPGQIGVDATGRVYVLDPGHPNYRVQRFTADGDFDTNFVRSFAVLRAGALAVDSSGDHVFVGRSGVVEYDGNGAVVDTHGPDAGIVDQTITGIGVKAGAAAFATGLDGYDGSLNARLYRLGNVTSSTGSLSPATAIEGRGATVNATINPNGAPVASYQIEVSADFGATFTTVPEVPVPVGDGAADVPVSYALTGLLPNNFYFYRVVVKRLYNADVVTDYDFFSTLTVAPTVSGTDAAPTERSAKLHAGVNPESLETTYRFEYGETASYGSVAPVTPVSVGSGRDPASAVKTVGGLEPGKTYHYRVVAENAAGVTYGPDKTFTTLTPALPGGTGDGANGRAFEQVSPVDKNGFAVRELDATVQATPSGDAVTYASNGAFGGAATSMLGGRYLARRGAADWTSQGVDAPQTNAQADLSTGVQDLTSWFSTDLRYAVQYSSRALMPEAIADGDNFYVQDNVTGARRLILAHNDPSGRILGAGTVNVVAASDDLSHVVFQSARDGIHPEASQGETDDLYELTGGEVRLVSRFPDGSVMPDGARIALDVWNSPTRMSADGRKIFFQNVKTGQREGLYMRVDGATTVAISSGPTSYGGAGRDGRYVFYSTLVGLTTAGQAQNDLFQYDTTTGTRRTVAQNVENIYAVSEDGTKAYFTRYTYSPASGGRFALVMWDGSREQEILDVSGGINGAWRMRPALSANGRFFAFETTRPGTGVDSGGKFEVFVYDAEAEELRCASCGGLPEDNRDSRLYESTSYSAVVSNHRRRQVLDDGRVFFTTSKALVRRDVNGVDDVYEQRVDGTVTLVSSGRGHEAARFAEASADGDDVFFLTAGGLVGQDVDGATDLYDARVGGGLAGQSTPAGAVDAPCREDVCQGGLTSPAPPAPAGTVTFTGPGNVGAGARARRAEPISVSALKRVTGSSGTLQVRVPTAGAVSISGPALRTARRAVKRAATVRVRFSLSTEAQRSLVRRGSLKATLKVTFVPTTGERLSKSLRVTFKRSTRKPHTNTQTRR
jgi:hypothetical protein